MLYRGSFVFLLAAVLVPSSAFADRIGGAEEMDLGELPLRFETDHLTLVTIRGALGPLAEGTETSTASPEQDAVEGGAPDGDATPAPTPDESAPIEEEFSSPPGSMLTGPSPWLYFDGAFSEGGCRHPRMSADGFAALAVCSGLDPKHPRDAHVVIRRGYAIYRYPIAVSPGASADLSADGERFAVLIEEGGSRTVHLIDMMERQDHRVVGGWREPGDPLVADDVDAVAFTAQVAGKEGAVLARIGEDGGAWRAWRGGTQVEVRGLTADGLRVLITAKAVDLNALFLVDPARGVRFDLSGRKGDVRGADLHPSGEAAVFSSSIGGVCAIWWVDLITRRRKDLISSVEGCFENVAMDTSRRLLLYEETARGTPPTWIYDRRRRDMLMSVPAGCAETVMSRDGAFLASRCTRSSGSAVFLLAVQEEPQ
jgi:hypothetical protein